MPLTPKPNVQPGAFNKSESALHRPGALGRFVSDIEQADAGAIGSPADLKVNMGQSRRLGQVHGP